MTEPLSAEEVEQVRSQLGRDSGWRAALNGSAVTLYRGEIRRLLATIDALTARAEAAEMMAKTNEMLWRSADRDVLRAADLLEAAEAERDRLDATNDRFGEAAEHFNQRIRSLEAERDRYKAALEEMLARHPDAIEGEHPAVDLARRALAPTTEGTE